jgi:lipoprotein signal peptidase
MEYIFALSILASILNIIFSFSLYSVDLCVLNSGVAFGINIYGEALLSAVLIVLIVIWGIKQAAKIRYLLFSLAVLGLSNLIVRVWHGSVCDYIFLFAIF